MRATYTAAELWALKLPCLPDTPNGIRRRADEERQNWPFRWGKVKGGYQKRYYAHQLPMEIRQAILALDKIDALVPINPQPPPADAKPITQAQQDKAMAKADLLRHYLQALATAAWGKKEQTRDGFMQAYNSGIAYPVLFAQLGEVSWQTIEGWKRTVKKSGDTFHLADRRGTAKKGHTGLTPVQTDILLACVLRPTKPRIAEAIRLAHNIMEAKGIENGLSEATYRRWLETWKETNHHIWVFNRQGAKAWNDQCAYYIERDLNLINVGDVIIADGHNLNFEIINPWTGKRQNHMTLVLFYDMRSNFPLGWEIMPTENTQAISSALRRAIIRLGKTPQVVYLDNGRAFKSKFFQGSTTSFDEAGYTGLYERLGIKTIFAWPYHGQSKPIERFFGSFAEAERMNAISYTGTSIEDKPARMKRGEKLHRAVHEKAFGDRCLTMHEAHLLVAAWFDEYANRPQTRNSHLKGQRPADVFAEGRGAGVDVPALDYLMMNIEVKTLHRNGVTFRGRNYYHPALYGRRHPVLIRYDLQDDSYLLVADQAGTHICRAEPTQKVHPAAAHLGTEADIQLLEAQIEHKKHQEKEAGASARAFLRDVIVPEQQRQLERIGVSGQVVAIDSKRGGIMPPVTVRKQLPAPITEADAQQIMAEAEELQREHSEQQAVQLNVELENLSEPDRYERLLEIEMQGQLVPKRWLAFMRYYDEVIAGAEDQAYWEARKEALAIMYGRQERAGVAAPAQS
jgi:putative transposase